MCPQGSLRADFYFSGQSQGTFHLTPKISMLRAHILAFRADFRAVDWQHDTQLTPKIYVLRAHSGHSGHSGQIFWHHAFIKIQKLKFIKIEMNVFLSFLKMWPFFTHWHPMFYYAQLHKKHHFCQFVWGGTQVHFQISLNVLYETIFNLHSFIET